MTGTTEPSVGHWFRRTAGRVVRDSAIGALVMIVSLTLIVTQTRIPIIREGLSSYSPEQLVSLASIGLVASTVPVTILGVALASLAIRMSVASGKRIMRLVAQRRAAAGVPVHV